MQPPIAMARMDFLVIKGDTSAPIELVPEPRSIFPPDTLDLFAPTGLKLFVQVKADADIDVAWD